MSDTKFLKIAYLKHLAKAPSAHVLYNCTTNLDTDGYGRRRKMPKEPKMLPADWLQYVADAERALKKPPNPPKRLQPKVTRHMSPRQRTALSQTKNPVRAIYQQESQYNVTPLLPDGAKTTKEVGPGDVNNSATNWRTGNMTVEPSINGNKVKPRHSHGSKGRKPSSDLDALLKEYGV